MACIEVRSSFIVHVSILERQLRSFQKYGEINILHFSIKALDFMLCIFKVGKNHVLY